jgi:hypothetical protein
MNSVTICFSIGFCPIKFLFYLKILFVLHLHLSVFQHSSKICCFCMLDGCVGDGQLSFAVWLEGVLGYVEGKR